MRPRPDLVFVSVMACLCFGLTRHAVQAYQLEPASKCSGNFNCASGPCVGPTNTGNSCATVTPIDHGLCLLAPAPNQCSTVTKDCAELQDYGGAPCEGAPCEGEPIGEPYKATQPGCDVPPGPG